MKDRRTLTDEEKKQLRRQWEKCYICELSLGGYSDDEIEYDHIYDYASGYTQELSDFAPVHASENSAKRNCHKKKGRKSPYEYKEELRINKELETISGLKDVCKETKESIIEVNFQNRVINLNGEKINIYSQKINNKDNWYFFHEIDKKYLESDAEIQLRPLDSRIVGLTFHLRCSLQLLPSVGRLDMRAKKIKIFDGQHKAVAQMIGNKRNKIACIVFIDPDIKTLRETVYLAHERFVQQRYAPSHIDNKLAEIYKKEIEIFREGDPNKPYSERDILKNQTKSQIRKDLQASIIDGLKSKGDFIEKFVYVSKKEQKTKPMAWKSLQIFVQNFANLDTVEFVTGDPKNHREAELNNLYFLLENLYEYSIKDKWFPQNMLADGHKLSALYYFTHSFKIWIKILEEALRNAYEQKINKKIEGALCYREEFSSEVKERFKTIIERLFIHGLWLNPDNRQTLQSSYEKNIAELFDKQRLDYIYLTKLD